MLAATVLGSSMAFIDGTVVNIALAALQSDLRATVADVQWVVEALCAVSRRASAYRRVAWGPLRPAPHLHDRCRSFCSRIPLVWFCGGYRPIDSCPRIAGYWHRFARPRQPRAAQCIIPARATGTRYRRLVGVHGHYCCGWPAARRLDCRICLMALGVFHQFATCACDHRAESLVCSRKLR